MDLTLSDLITWLQKQKKTAKVKDGFGSPHSDRGDYYDLAFDPVPETTFGDMLKHAESALGATFEGYKGGEFTMYGTTDCKIASYGMCGEHITSAHLKLWLLTAED